MGNKQKSAKLNSWRLQKTEGKLLKVQKFKAENRSNPNYPFNMTDLERQEPILELLGHLAQVCHVLIFEFPQTLNL